jgi:hypothetical protein
MGKGMLENDIVVIVGIYHTIRRRPYRVIDSLNAGNYGKQNIDKQQKCRVNNNCFYPFRKCHYGDSGKKISLIKYNSNQKRRLLKTVGCRYHISLPTVFTN